jgi:hypothetical protein
MKPKFAIRCLEALPFGAHIVTYHGQLWIKKANGQYVKLVDYLKVEEKA